MPGYGVASIYGIAMDNRLMDAAAMRKVSGIARASVQNIKSARKRKILEYTLPPLQLDCTHHCLKNKLYSFFNNFSYYIYYFLI